MKVHHFFKMLLPAVLVLVLSVSFAGFVHTKDVSGGAVGRLDQVHADAGVKCDSCHGTGKRSDPVRMETCVACHGDSKALAAITAKVKPTNPHERNPHYGTETDCNLCHHQHQKSVEHCSDCHYRFDFKVP